MATEEIIGSFADIVVEKSFMFERSHFKRWQQKMKFLMLKKVVNFLIDDILSLFLDQSNKLTVVNLEI